MGGERKIFKSFLSLMQAVREENKGLKQEMEALKTMTAEQVRSLKSLRKEVAVFFTPHSVFFQLYFSLITGTIRVNDGRSPEHVRSLKLTLVFCDHPTLSATH